MNIHKLFTPPITILISFTLLLFIIHLLLKHFKAKIDEEGKIKISYGIWFAALFLSGSNIITSIVAIGLEATDNIYKMQPTGIIMELIRATACIIGLGFVWFLIWYFIVKFLIKMVYKTDDEQEMANDNYTYFLMKGVVLLGTIFSLSAIFELMLRMTIPTIDLPFYH